MDGVLFVFEDIALKAQAPGHHHPEPLDVDNFGAADHRHVQPTPAGRGPAPDHADPRQQAGLGEAGETAHVHQHPALAGFQRLAQAGVHSVHGLRKGLGALEAERAEGVGHGGLQTESGGFESLG